MPENKEQSEPEEKKEKKTYKKHLSFQDRLFIKGIEDGLRPTQAAIEAGYSKSYSKNAKNTIMEKAGVKEALSRLMDRQGLSDSKLLEGVALGMICTKLVEIDGEVVEVADHANRRHYLRMALDLKALFPSKEVKVEHTNKTLEDMLKEIKGRGIERDITPEALQLDEPEE